MSDLTEVEILKREIEALRLENQALRLETQTQRKEFIDRIVTLKETIVDLKKENSELKIGLKREKLKCEECNCYGEYIQGFILCRDCYEKDKDYYISRR